jgi:integrase
MSQISGKPVVGINKVWLKVRKLAGLSDVPLHDLRHSFATFAVEDGARTIWLDARWGMPMLLPPSAMRTQAIRLRAHNGTVRRCVKNISTALGLST